jgi:uncharacterized protein (DUF1499 family)
MTSKSKLITKRGFIQVRSASGVGRSDLDVNRRLVARLQEIYSLD